MCVWGCGGSVDVGHVHGGGAGTCALTQPVSALWTLSPCSLTLLFLIWNQNPLETAAEKSGLLGRLLDERLAGCSHHNTPPPPPSHKAF